MPCLTPVTPTLAIEVSINSDRMSFRKLKPGDPVLYKQYPGITSSASMRNVPVDADGKMVFYDKAANKHYWSKCLNIVYVLEPNVPYQFSLDSPIDFWPAENDPNPHHQNTIDKKHCEAKFGVVAPGDLQVERPMVNSDGGKNVILSLTYHNHTIIDDTRPPKYSTSKPEHYITDVSYYRLRVEPYQSTTGSSRHICSQSQVPNGDHGHPHIESIPTQ